MRITTKQRMIEKWTLQLRLRGIRRRTELQSQLHVSHLHAKQRLGASCDDLVKSPFINILDAADWSWEPRMAMLTTLEMMMTWTVRGPDILTGRAAGRH